MKETTIKEIAAGKDLHPIYVQKLAREKGFPDPIRMIGPTKLFDAHAVDRYFRERAKKRKAA